MPEPTHHSYLLRLWREHEGAPLRATLIVVGQPDTHQHFAALEALYDFLHAGRRRTRRARRSGHDAFYRSETS